jgi:Spy/CpxP family protein refolding chaperone
MFPQLARVDEAAARSQRARHDRRAGKRMNLTALSILLLGLGATVQAAAQTAAPSPYRSELGREVKALSPEQITDYLEGHGMGFARAAELNHYPGPAHVLELAQELGLGDGQLAGTRGIHALMQQAARTLGARIVERERELDALFSSGSATTDAVAAVLRDIGVLRGQLRFVHLAAHIKQRELLTPEQIGLYDRLRGYDDATGPSHRHGSHSH